MKKVTLLIGLLYATYTSAQAWIAYRQIIVDIVTLASVAINLNEFVASGEKRQVKQRQNTIALSFLKMG